MQENAAEQLESGENHADGDGNTNLGETDQGESPVSPSHLTDSQFQDVFEAVLNRYPPVSSQEVKEAQEQKEKQKQKQKEKPKQEKKEKRKQEKKGKKLPMPDNYTATPVSWGGFHSVCMEYPFCID